MLELGVMSEHEMVEKVTVNPDFFNGWSKHSLHTAIGITQPPYSDHLRSARSAMPLRLRLGTLNLSNPSLQASTYCTWWLGNHL